MDVWFSRFSSPLLRSSTAVPDSSSQKLFARGEDGAPPMVAAPSGAAAAAPGTTGTPGAAALPSGIWKVRGYMVQVIRVE